MLRSGLLAVSLAVTFFGCDKAAEPTTEPIVRDEAAEKAAAEKAAAEKAAAEKAAAEKAAADAYANRDFFTVATFNLAWAHDNVGSGPKAAKTNRAQKDEDWEWKAKAIGALLAHHKPDVIALHELGGSDELHDIVLEISKAGGPEYDYAYEDSVDDRNGHNTGVISRLPISNDRRLDIYLKRHLIADVELPNGDNITLAAIHPPEGTRASAKKGRIKQVQVLKRKLRKVRAQRPILYLSSMGTNMTAADEGYSKSAPGMLAGANNSSPVDDCEDSAQVGATTVTTTDDRLADRIFSCGLTMRGAKTVGEDEILRGYADKWDVPWSTVSVDKDPMRDLSDHFIVVAEIELPKPPPKEETEENTEAADAE